MKKLDSNGFNIQKLEFVPHVGHETFNLNQEEIKFISNAQQTLPETIVIQTEKKLVV